MIEGRSEGRRNKGGMATMSSLILDGLEGGNPELHSLHQSQPLVIFDVSRER
jgi:hypothetical protein